MPLRNRVSEMDRYQGKDIRCSGTSRHQMCRGIRMRVMQATNGQSFQHWRISAICILLASFLFVSLPALAQNLSQTTMTGTVVSFSKNTLVVKGEGGQYRLFVFDRNTVKP